MSNRMRNIIIFEIKKFIEDENGLTGDEWQHNYFTPTEGKSYHVSDVEYIKLDDNDLLRFLSYLLLERDRASEYRLNNLYFNKD